MSSRRDITKLQNSLETLKKSTPVSYFPAEPTIGEVGAFRVITVRAVINEDTLLVSTGDTALLVHPMPTKSIKIGYRGLNGELFKVKANRLKGSNLMYNETILAMVRHTIGTVPILLVVEPIKKKDVDEFRKQYQHEKVVNAVRLGR